jgi:hypothetical protein
VGNDVGVVGTTVGNDVGVVATIVGAAVGPVSLQQSRSNTYRQG